MKVYFKQFLDPSLHSWANVGTNIARELKKFKHDVSLCSTNGYEGFYEDLKENIACQKCTTPQDVGKNQCEIKGNFDLSIAYTQMSHFLDYLKFGRNRFGIWIYDGTEIPKGYIKYHKGATKILAPSNFAKNTFENCGVPKDKLYIIPHGYNDEFINRQNVINLNTNRKRKILINIQQCHTRKNIPGILDVWGKTFTNKDDVTLIAKIKDKKPTSSFEISWKQELDKFKRKYKNHAPIIVINDFITNISDLYRACDIVFSMSNIEGFWLPGLEGLASNKLVIASGGNNCCGNIDFMNENNSLLINGKPVRAPFNYQYWKSSTYGEMFQPDKIHASELLFKAVNEYDQLIKKFTPGIQKVKEQYSWSNITNQIINLVE